MNDLVLREDLGGVAVLTLNDARRLNALSKSMVEALGAHVAHIARETRTIGAVILRGAGGNFSSGYDMREVLAHVKARAKPHFHAEVIQQLANLPQPVISAVEGYCSTGGMELALAGDIIACTESSQFSDDYARWGLTPVWGLSLRLPHRVGTAKASEMMFTCRKYSGREAFDMHLANFCSKDEDFEADLSRVVADILSNSWYSNQVNKRMLVASQGMAPADAHALEMFKNEGLAPDAEKRVSRFAADKNRT